MVKLASQTKLLEPFEGSCFTSTQIIVHHIVLDLNEYCTWKARIAISSVMKGEITTSVKKFPVTKKRFRKVATIVKLHRLHYDGWPELEIENLFGPNSTFDS